MIKLKTFWVKHLTLQKVSCIQARNKIDAVKKSGWPRKSCSVHNEKEDRERRNPKVKTVTTSRKRGGPAGKRTKKVVKILITAYATYRAELRWCGKKTCTTCPHGPYWYAYFYQRGVGERGKHGGKGKTKIVYIGKIFKYLPDDQAVVLPTFKRRKKR